MVALSTLLWISAKPILKFIVFAGCGAIMARHGLLTPAGAKVIAGLILNYTLPALLFAKMVTCVSPDNIEELGFVALVAVFYILMGAVFGFMIQRTKLIPKRLHWGIVAATMFTNFGDLPISIILAVSDHPPFLVGDGARGTAYSSVFISVFYLFLFPLGGYRLIRYDHIKESDRLQSLTAAHREREQSEPSSSGDTMTPPLNRNQKQHQQADNQSPHHLKSPGQQHPLRQDPNGLQSSFSATSTMISMDYMGEENHFKELRYRPHDPETSMSSPKARCGNAGMDPLVNQQGSPTNNDSNNHSFDNRNHCQDPHPHYLLQVLRTTEAPRSSVESFTSNGSGATRFSMGYDEDHLIKSMGKAAASSSSPLSKKPSLRPPVFNKSYQPPPLHPLSNACSASTGSSNSSRSNSLPAIFAPSGSSVRAKSDLQVNGEGLTTVPLSEPSSPQSNGPALVIENSAPVPKVPPHLERSYASKHNDEEHWFWRAFHSTREYLTPPTIGLIIGLLSTLTPLRALFVLTDHPIPTPDELPPLSFILEVTLMLGACCVPLGLTVLGASLSRLKPGRLRPMIPALTMITVAKLVISPCIGILLVQLVLVRQFGWVSVQNHMLQFTLMLMSGTPTSITCFVLAQVWDRRTKNAGSEMAALIAIQYAVSTVLLTFGCAFMMYFLF
ncbi:hypothetical protein BGZ65_006744 [Modicella reniformis]|uniref:Auxin efflux carrier n=1 Tax=Modicella reniformis TaxID=1440133 RepID=A0A9P6MKI1_9FUNG|nr:hypothetical protein BGZ65_006744 [Modicella reniformis]